MNCYSIIIFTITFYILKMDDALSSDNETQMITRYQRENEYE